MSALSAYLDRRRGSRLPAFPKNVWWVVSMVAALAVAVFTGLVASLGSTKLDLVLGALVLGGFGLFVPITWVFWVLVVSTFVLLGPAQYFLKVSAFWGPFLIGALLFLRLPIDAQQRGANAGRGHSGLSLLEWLVVLFVATVFLSAVVNGISMLSLFVAARNYIYLSSLLFLLAFSDLTPRLTRRAWIFLGLVSFLQLPFALYQRFVVATHRIDETKLDAVVGTFLGSQEGGGDSGGMAFFLVAVLVVALYSWDKGLLKGRWVLLLAASALATVLLAEVKVVFALIPAAFFLIFGADAIRRPARFLMGLVLTCAGLALILATYGIATGAKGEGNFGWDTTELVRGVNRAFRSTTDLAVFNRQTGEVGRRAAFWLWAKKNGAQNPEQYVIGHGPGAAGTQFGQPGTVTARYYPYQVAPSSAALLLWELGLVGFLGLSAILVYGAAKAYALSRRPDIPNDQRVLLRAVAVVLVLNLLMLPYSKAILGASPPTQVMLMLMLGQVAYWSRRDRSRVP